MSVKNHLAPDCHTLAIATLIVGSQFLIAAPSSAADGCSACIFENEPTLTEWRRCVEICDKYECYPGHYAACNGSPEGRTECQLDTDSSSGDYVGSSFSDAPSACDSIDCSQATYPERGADFDTANCPGQYEWILYACEDPEPYTNSVGFSCENASSGSGSPITNRRDFCNEQCPSLYACKDGFVGEASVETPCNPFHPTSGSECVVSDSGSARVSAIFEPTPDVCECPPDDERSCTGGNPDCESFGRQECVRVLNDYESRWSSCGGEDECDEDGECDEETDQDCCEEQVGAPVNLRTGEVTLSLDLNFEVRVGAETLGLNPRYSSQQAMREYERDALATERGPVQFFGAGWTHRFDHRIQDLPGTNNAVYYGPSGKALTFDNRVQLEKGIGRGSKGGYTLTENDAGFTLVGRSGETLMFERVQESSVDIGRLSSIVDESGSTLDFTYWSTDGSAPCQTTTGSPEEGRLCLVSLNDKATLHFAVYAEVACTASDCDEQSESRLASATVGLGIDPGDHKKRLVIGYASAELRSAKDGTTCADRSESCVGEVAARPTSFHVDVLDGTWTEVARRDMTYTDKSYYRPDLSGDFDQQQTIFVRPLDATGTFFPERSVWLLTQILDEVGALIEGHQYDKWGRGVTSEIGGEFLRIEFSNGDARVFNESDGSFLFASVDRTSSDPSMNLGGDVGCFEKTGRIDFVSGTRRVDKKTSQDGIIKKYFYDDRNRVEYIVEGRESDFESCLSEETPPDLATLTDFGGHPFAVCSGSSVSGTRFSVQKLEYGDTHRPTRIIRAYSALRMGQLSPGGAPNTSSTRRNRETSFLYDEGGIRVLRRTEKGYTRRRGTSGTETNVYDFQRLQNYSYTDAGDLELVRHQAFDGIKPDVKFTYHEPGAGGDAGQLFQVLAMSRFGEEPDRPILTYRDYDSFGNATRLVDENGVTTLRRFDGNNRLIEMVEDATGPSPRTMAFEYLDNGWQCRATQIGGGNGTHVSTFYGATTGYSGASSACSYTANPICRTQDETAEGELPDASEVSSRQEDCLEALGALGQPSMLATGVYDGNTFADFALASLRYDPASRLVSRISQSVTPDPAASPGTPGFITSDERKVAFSHADALSLAVEKFTANALDPVGTATQLRDPNSKRRMGSSEEFPTAAGQLRLDYEYDERGDLRAVRAVNADDGSIQLLTTYDYDPAGNLYRMVRGDKEYFYFHDDFGNLVRVKSPDSGVTRYHYGAAGYLERMVVDDAGIDVRINRTYVDGGFENATLGIVLCPRRKTEPSPTMELPSSPSRKPAAVRA
ncbi:MAG: hypothetical protein AAFZ38_02070 [Myxococcota bacterium]